MSDDDTKTEDKVDDTKQDGDEKPDTGADADAERTYTRAEYEAIHARMQAADRTATRLQQEKQQAEDAKKDVLTRAQEENARLQKEIATLKETNKTTLMKADFGLAGVQWHNPSTAYTTLLNEYPDAVSVDENGKVIGMKAAVEKLAKEHAYLVKSTEEKKDEKDEASAATGPVKNGKRKGDQGDDAMSEALRVRMPALAARTRK